ncbi:MAG: LuxR C-terminal-related transcriptional regulator [Chloroflexota bacterium]
MEKQAFPQTVWLAQTKLQRPRLRDDIVPRQRLSNLLHKAVGSHRLTLISAPAGYGKTTLITALAHTATDFAFAWLSLDEEDNNPTAFLIAFVAALQKLNPDFGRSIHALLGNQATPNLDAKRTMALLINDVLAFLPDSFVLVLDDLHCVTETAVFQALDYLLAHLPAQMHIIVTTRVDPPLALARLRARGQLMEIGPPDLRFTLAETADFLNGQLELSLSNQDLKVLQTRTTGWIAGLRLLTTSLTQLPAASQRATLVTRKLKADHHVFDLLAEEVLNRQPPILRTFLLETSILSELTPELCQAVTSHADAPIILEEIYRRNLFIDAVDNGGLASSPTYRYQALFVEFLRRQLVREQPDHLAKYHRRAADAHTNPVQKIAHYMAAKQWEAAAQVIEQIAESIYSQGLLNRLQSWIQNIPAPVRENHPWLLYYLGICVWGQGQFSETQRLLKEALTGFEAAADDKGRGETMVQLSIVHQIQGNLELVPPLIQQALSCPISPSSRIHLNLSLAWLALHQANLKQAQTHLITTLDLAEASNETAVLQTLAMQIRAPFLCLPNGIALLERTSRLIASRVPAQVNPLQANVDGLMTLIHFWRGQLDEAIEAGERAWTTSQRLGGLSWLTVDMGHLLMLLYTLRNDTAKAEQALNHFAPLIDNYAVWRVNILYLCSMVHWNQNRIDEMRQVYGQMQASKQAYEWPTGPVLRAMIKGLLEIADQDYPNAEQTLRVASNLQTTTPVSEVYGSTRLLLAYLYHCWDRPEAALKELAPVLAYHQRRGTPGLLLMAGSALIPLFQLAVTHNVQAKFASQLVTMLAQENTPKPLFIPETGATLTPREVEVLRLLATGASNRAIAAELVVSIPTVKTHVSRILGKLNVKSRARAAAAARDIHLV